MSWQDNMLEAIAEMLRSKGVDAVKVVSFEDRTDYGGYCDTCSYTEVVCDFVYVNSEGKTKTYTHYSSFADLINSL